MDKGREASLGAWSKTCWSNKDDIWESRSLEYAILAFPVDSGIDFWCFCSAGTELPYDKFWVVVLDRHFTIMVLK